MDKDNYVLFIFIFIVIILLLLFIFIVFFSGFIPKTRKYYLKKMRLFLLKTDCHNHSNITYLLKHFGYIDKVVENEDLKRLSEDKQMIINKKTAQFTKDYKFKNDPELKKEMDKLIEKSKQRCNLIGEYYVRHLRIFYHTIDCDKINNPSNNIYNNPTYLLQHFGYLEKPYDDYNELEKDGFDRKKIDIINDKFRSKYKIIENDALFSKQIKDIKEKYELECIIEGEN